MKSDMTKKIEEIGPLNFIVESSGNLSRQEAIGIIAEMNNQGYALSATVPLESGRALYVGTLDRSTFARNHEDKRPWSKRNNK